ncbi:MAG: hypothetical protein M3142_09725, partial [Bacteroidota bacterium]|nr:hypothetical protein [Bacteroidota bacterium]
ILTCTILGDANLVYKVREILEFKDTEMFSFLVLKGKIKMQTSGIEFRLSVVFGRIYGIAK